MKLSTITIIAAIIICCYWLTSLADAYYRAIGAYLDIRNSKQIETICGRR